MHLLAAAQSGDWSKIGGSFQQSMTGMWTKLAGFIPNLIGMLLILAIGYVVSKVLQWTATALLKRIRFDKAAEKTGLSESMGRIGVKRTASEIAADVLRHNTCKPRAEKCQVAQQPAAPD